MLNCGGSGPGRPIPRDHLQRLGEGTRGYPRKARHHARHLRGDHLELVRAIPLPQQIRESRADLAHPVVDHRVLAGGALFLGALATNGEDHDRVRVRECRGRHSVLSEWIASDGTPVTSSACEWSLVAPGPSVNPTVIVGGLSSVAWIVHISATRLAAA